jgi:hypothetical protein
MRSPLEEAHALEGISRCLVLALDASGGIAHLSRALTSYQLLGAPETAFVVETLVRLQATERERRAGVGVVDARA